MEKASRMLVDNHTELDAHSSLLILEEVQD